MITNYQKRTLRFLYKYKNQFLSECDFIKKGKTYNFEELDDLKEKSFLKCTCDSSVSFFDPSSVRVSFDHQYAIDLKGIAFVESENRKKFGFFISLFLAIIGFFSFDNIVPLFKRLCGFLANLFT